MMSFMTPVGIHLICIWFSQKLRQCIERGTAGNYQERRKNCLSPVTSFIPNFGATDGTIYIPLQLELLSPLNPLWAGWMGGWMDGWMDEQNRIEQNRIEQNRIEQNRTEKNRIEQNRIEQNRIEQKTLFNHDNSIKFMLSTQKIFST